MKNALQLSKKILILFLALSPLRHFAQKSPLKYEILVYFLPDSLELPASNKGQVLFEKASIKSNSLKKHFTKVRPTSIAKSFPDWNEKDSVKTREDGQKVKMPKFSRIFTLRFATEEAADSAVAQLKQSKAVLFAEKHSKPTMYVDPKYDDGTQYHLKNIYTIGADVHAEAAWQLFTGNSNITIAIIDSGVELSHEDLTGKSSGESPINNTHGTHVAGIAGAISNNGKGGRGLDWNARLLSKRIFDTYVDLYNQGYIGDNNVATKIIEAVNEGAHILNHSWGSPDYSSSVALAFSYAYKMNRTSVVAMGNEGNNTIEYPAAFNNVISVGATDNTDNRVSFSSTGNHIDVSAPGSSIYSTVVNNSYSYLSGTSMATPLVTGLASLLKGYNTNLSNDDIENIIKASTDKVGSDPYINGFNTKMGFGRINARKALDLLRAPYVLNNQLSTTGGTDYSTSNQYIMQVYGNNSLADGNYLVQRHEIRKDIVFSQPFCQIVGAWGRGTSSSGWSAAQPNFSVGFCDIVPGGYVK